MEKLFWPSPCIDFADNCPDNSNPFQNDADDDNDVGTSSATKGYCSGGSTNSPETAYVDHIQEFNFSTEANATDVGNLTLARAEASPQSSETYSYTSGGKGPFDRIDRFAYSNPGANSTDVGNLTAALTMTAGTQN